MFNFKRIKQKIKATLWQAAKHVSLNLIKNKLIQEDGYINVYTDGSCNYKDGRLGTGVIIQTIDPTIQLVFSEAIQPSGDFDLKRFGAMKAEFSAATKALEKLPNRTNVHIYTDHPLLRRVLNRHIKNHNLLWRPHTSEGHARDFIDMVDKLKQELLKKDEVRVTNLKDSQSRRMQMAHEAAAKGSGAREIKKRLAKNPPPVVENAFLIGDPRDNEGEEISSCDPRDTNPWKAGPDF